MLADRITSDSIRPRNFNLEPFSHIGSDPNFFHSGLANDNSLLKHSCFLKRGHDLSPSAKALASPTATSAWFEHSNLFKVNVPSAHRHLLKGIQRHADEPTDPTVAEHRLTLAYTCGYFTTDMAER
ncbi:unnamed protein product [Schistocephalus solidus]|uniref:Uncharacterized protein n=1 Tax=Schistocephalus solidus TaxID=70667 RepID=A0A3P7ECC0_SCHSO|nr:unnamed protein product [Schistocephalus solidus]